MYQHPSSYFFCSCTNVIIIDIHNNNNNNIATLISTYRLTQIISGDLDKAGGSHLELQVELPAYPDLRFGTFTGTIDDYNTTWYFSVGASLMFTMFIFSLGQLPTQYGMIIFKKLKLLWDQRYGCKEVYTHTNTQDELNDLYIGPQMLLEQRYAYLLTLIFVDMTYAATMPLFHFITLLNLFVFFISDKFTLLYFLKKPALVNPDLPKHVVNVMFVAGFISLANGMWMFGNDDFSNPEIENDYSTVSSNSRTYLDNEHDY